MLWPRLLPHMSSYPLKRRSLCIRVFLRCSNHPTVSGSCLYPFGALLSIPKRVPHYYPRSTHHETLWGMMCIVLSHAMGHPSRFPTLCQDLLDQRTVQSSTSRRSGGMLPLRRAAGEVDGRCFERGRDGQVSPCRHLVLIDLVQHLVWKDSII